MRQLEITGLSKTYSNGVKALDNVSLSIGKGIYGLLGANGAGKSTLMQILATLQPPTSGQVRLNGIDAVYLNTEGIKEFCPIINTSQNIRYPVLGGTLQRRAGTARHDAVAWGYARGAYEMGVDIIQNCEVKAIKRNADSVEGIETTKGFIKTKKMNFNSLMFKFFYFIIIQLRIYY